FILPHYFGAPDETGRKRPIPVEGSEFTMPCDSLIMAIGQTPEVEPLISDTDLETTDWSGLIVDETTLQTNIEEIFAGGDCVTGPDIVVNAMEAGKRAAESIHRYINGLDLREGRELEGPYESDIEVDTENVQKEKRIETSKLDATERKGFEEVNQGFTEDLAKREAERCLNCAICCDCRLCDTVCDADAIDYSMKDEIIEEKFGNAIIATGYDLFDPEAIKQFGYEIYENVYTALEVERMVDAAGPTEGEILLSNGKKPESVAIIHCVGSRDENYHKYCSSICCMYSMKLAHLIKEETEADVYEYYIDIRATGKGYEEFYDRLLEENVKFIRGIPGRIEEEDEKLIVYSDDSLSDKQLKIPVDMVVLSPAIEPRSNSGEVAKKFMLSKGEDGFFMERHPKLAPVNTSSDGIFLAGACQGPKDIPDSVAQGSAAAQKADSMIDAGSLKLEPFTSAIDEDICAGCKTCIKVCPFDAAVFDEEKGVARIEETLCKGCGTCVASCPSGAAYQFGYKDEQINAEVIASLEEVPET
ncbi:pyridine nucleotide-disulfide oxidoreductase, partial [candidate division MSBL1 archaeon SCGC-AAA259B11]